MKHVCKTISESLRLVYSTWRYFLISAIVVVVILVVASLIPSWSLVTFTVHAKFFTFWGKIQAIFSYMLLFFTATPFWSVFLTVLVAFLAGGQVAVVVYYFRHKFVMKKVAGIGLVGLVLGFFGVGCTACGSVILAAVFGLGASTALLGVLPLKGLEFSILSVVLLLVSTYVMAKKVVDPIVCGIAPERARSSNDQAPNSKEIPNLKSQ